MGHREVRDAERGSEKRLKAWPEEWKPQQVMLVFLLPQMFSSEHQLRCQKPGFTPLALTLTS